MPKLYQQFIKPRDASPDGRNRELVLNFLLIGAISLMVVLLLTTFINFLVTGQQFLLPRMLWMLVTIGFTGSLYALARCLNQQKLVSFVLVGLFLAAGTMTIYQWGILIPLGVLLFGLSIVMSSILLGSRYALYSLGLIVVIMASLAYMQDHGISQPNVSWQPGNANTGDLFAFYSVFAILAGISWLFNQQMERSLRRARKSEAAVKKQKELLEIKVEERTRELENAQLEKVQQIYRFAELGRTSSALFHDLANHLASVSLDIAGLEASGRSDIMRRIQRDIKYVDDVVQRVRFQLRGHSEIEEFDVANETATVIKLFKHKATQNRVEINLVKPRRKLRYTSDITRFRQIVMNLLINAIEAYPTPDSSTNQRREVVIKIEHNNSTISLSVTDWGVGIEAGRLDTIFEPFYTDKSEGTGIGLFIVKQIVEQDLGGKITVKSNFKNGTTFNVKLPA